jgi:hypothetical protein
MNNDKGKNLLLDPYLSKVDILSFVHLEIFHYDVPALAFKGYDQLPHPRLHLHAEVSIHAGRPDGVITFNGNNRLGHICRVKVSMYGAIMHGSNSVNTGDGNNDQEEFQEGRSHVSSLDAAQKNVGKQSSDIRI